VTPPREIPREDHPREVPPELLVVKWGGSLITDKRRPQTPRPDTIDRLAQEIATLKAETGAAILLGHGSGSFGHAAAARHDVRGSLERDEQRRGAVITQLHAGRLHRMVVEALGEAGALPASIAPSSSVIAEAGVPVTFPFETVERTVALGWTPVLYGDVVVDRQWGAAICSTESLLQHLLVRPEELGAGTGDRSEPEQSELAELARARPQRRRFTSNVRAIYWLGETAGIYDAAGKTIPTIRPDNLETVRRAIGATAGTDVTGGMGLRLETAWTLATHGIASWILDGRQPGILARAVATADAAADLPGTFLPAHPA